MTQHIAIQQLDYEDPQRKGRVAEYRRRAKLHLPITGHRVRRVRLAEFLADEDRGVPEVPGSAELSPVNSFKKD